MPRPLRRPVRIITLVVAGSALLLAFLASSASAAGTVDFAKDIEFSAGEFPQHEAVGDLNGDHIPDLVVTNWQSGTASILLGTGDGSFQPPTTLAVGTRADGVVIADFNGDGYQDLAIVEEAAGVVAVFLGNGDGTFKPKSTYHVRYYAGNIAVGDFNGDGKPDLAVSASEGVVSILLNNGDGTFTTKSEVPAGGDPMGIAIADFNGDGRADIAVADLSDNDVSVLLGKGNGTFEPATAYPVGAFPSAIATGEFDEDGHPDLVVTSQSSSSVSVLLGNGDGSFEPQVTYPVGSTPSSVAVGDLNGDGDPDLAVTDQGGAAVSVLLGDGEGNFAPQVSFAAGNTPSGVAIADFNGDGREDLSVINEIPGTGSIMLNAPKPTFSTQASTSVALGNPITDTATIEGASPTGTITFSAYGAEDEMCQFVPAFVSQPVTVEGNGDYPSPEFTPTEPGTYRWVAEYSGDSENGAAAGACNDAGESVLVTNPAPTLSTEASAGITIGGMISDTATIGGGLNPGGTLTFQAYGPDDANCSSAPAFTSAPVTVEGDGEYISADFTPTAAGTYRWIAEYSGDAENEAAFGGCNDADESVTVGKAATTTSLTATPNPADSGATVTLIAQVTGADPSGAVTFEDGTTVIGTVALGADGTAALTTSNLAVGSHSLSASYDGDTGNLASDSASLGLTVNAPAVEPTTPAQTDQGSGSSTTQGPGSSAPLTSTPPPASPAKPKVKLSIGFKRPPASKAAQGYRYTFRLSSSVAGSTFYCRLDNAKFKRCKTPVVFRHVKSGHHTFAVKAIAPSGAESATKKATFVPGKQN